MGRKVKTGKDRLDRYYHLAKEQGYRARSAFKLIQLAQKYDIFKNCQVLVDLCAAPGGWLQVAKRHMGVSSKIIGVDLVSIKSIPGVTTFKCDITTEQCKKLILNNLEGLSVDVVLHDGAPNVGTSWNRDAYIQNELVLHSTKLACDILRPGGIFITKIFRSSDYNSLIWVLSQLFKTVRATKPQSSRNVSAEIFLVCLDYKAPHKIDSKFFDPKFIFTNSNDIDESQELRLTEMRTKKVKPGLSELMKNIGKRNRDGYEEDDFRIINLFDFFYSENPAQILLKSQKIRLLPIDNDNTEEREFIKLVLNNKRTNEEIKILCDDLKVLGKNELMQLLKWRFLVLKEIGLYRVNNSNKDIISEVEDNGINEDENNDIKDSNLSNLTEDSEDIDNELNRVLEIQRKRNKVLEKKKKALLKKQEWRLSLSKGGFDVTRDEPDLFHYTPIVADILEQESQLVDPETYFPDSDFGHNVNENLLGIDMVLDTNEDSNYSKKSISYEEQTINESEDSEEEYIDHHMKLDIDLEVQDIIRKSSKNKNENIRDHRKGVKETRRKKIISDWCKEINEFSNQLDIENEKILAEKVVSQMQDDNEESNDEKNEVYNTGKITENDNKSMMWFSNPLFDDILNNKNTPELENTLITKLDNNKSDNKSILIKELNEDEIPQIPLSEKKRKKLEKQKKEVKSRIKDKTQIEFIIPSSTIKCPTSEKELEEVQAIGSLLVNKSTRMDLIDGSYNRYSFHDPIEDGETLGLPSWFVEDEMKHNKPELPVTKELMAQYKAKIREISRRTIRKEVEALYRKKRRQEKLLQKARQKALAIADSEEMNETSKSKVIQNLMKRAKSAANSKRSTVYAVTRRHGITKEVNNKKGKDIKGYMKNVKTKFVDKRLKKDKRATKRIEKNRNKKSKRNRKKF
ncbi:rRNA methyltransferase 3 [Cryptosporidium andersoni]|uniref:Putative rRNA methyltransferase n=1 Tax=Cryptosporidium andersoni TaxID=117008 RepID=A0A1J4MJV5_9CRYT|nr:rRNA methyltransferase 3 [Cryptosporidium andersoni]